MGSDREPANRSAKPCEIVVRGELSDRLAPEFEGMVLVAGHERTALVGEVVDQSHLHGLLDHIRDFGLELLSVEVLPQREEG